MIRDRGEIYTWGGGGTSYNKGQCGHGHFNNSESPAMVVGLQGRFVTKISCGGFHTVCIARGDDGFNEVYSWGSGYHGQLGTGEGVNCHTPTRIKAFDAIVGKKGDILQEDINIVEISAGGHHTLMLSDKGHVYACGSGQYGQLGLGPKLTSNVMQPTQVFCLTNK